MTVWRGQAQQTIEVPTAQLPGTDVDRLVEWAGATLQAPHRAMSAQRGIAPVGVYVGYFAYGSPATRYGLYPGRRIVEVDGVPTPDLDAFLKARHRAAGPLLGAPEDHHLEQRAGSDHAEARQALLAGLRAEPHGGRLAAARPRVAHSRPASAGRDTAVERHGRFRCRLSAPL